MKWITTLALIALGGLLPIASHGADEVRMEYFGEGYQLVYFGVLEGLFRDGVNDEDLDQILRAKHKHAYYEHFIYACPICTATVHALEMYRERPRFYGLKDHSPPAKFRTFGKGLPEDIRAKLRDEDSGVRLAVIHKLVSGWVNDRLQSLDLTDEEREQLQAELEDGRKCGMEWLTKWQADPEDLETYAPAYADLKECAICNAPLRMDFKTEKKKP